MPLTDLQPADVNKKTAEDLRALWRETPDFPVPDNLDVMLKAEIVDKVVDFLKEKNAPPPAPPEPPSPAVKPPETATEPPPPPEDLEYTESEVLAELKKMGFRDKSEAMSMLKGIMREQAMLGHRVKELDERQAAMDKREVELKGLDKWIDKKKKELEAVVLEKKKLVGLIEQARAQGITV